MKAISEGLQVVWTNLIVFNLYLPVRCIICTETVYPRDTMNPLLSTIAWWNCSSQ